MSMYTLLRTNPEPTSLQMEAAFQGKLDNVIIMQCLCKHIHMQNQYWTCLISEHSRDSKRLWRYRYRLFLNETGKHLKRRPTSLPTNLLSFFVDKVERVRTDTNSAAPPSFVLARNS